MTVLDIENIRGWSESLSERRRAPCSLSVHAEGPESCRSFRGGELRESFAKAARHTLTPRSRGGQQNAGPQPNTGLSEPADLAMDDAGWLGFSSGGTSL